MLDIGSLGNKRNLPPYAQDILNLLRPKLERLDMAKLDDKSAIEIKNENIGWCLRLTINSIDENVPSLSLFASNQQCILGFAGGEVIECHTNPGRDETLVDMVVKATERYLEGITILDGYNRYGKLIRKECFFGIDTESDKNQRIGVSLNFLTFPIKVCSTSKTTFRFLKNTLLDA